MIKIDKQAKQILNQLPMQTSCQSAYTTSFWTSANGIVDRTLQKIIT